VIARADDRSCRRSLASRAIEAGGACGAAGVLDRRCPDLQSISYRALVSATGRSQAFEGALRIGHGDLS
jgi:hypothetical protein